MLPFFDMLNHRTGQQIVWEAEGGDVVFRASGCDIEPGDEVCNNYGGGRSNEELLFYYGFAESDSAKATNEISGFTLLCDADDSNPDALALLSAKHARLASEHVPCGLLGAARGTLRLGPFTLGPTSAAPLAPTSAGIDAGSARASEPAPPRAAVPPLLYHALDVAVAEQADDAFQPGTHSLDALGLLHGSLNSTLVQERVALESDLLRAPESGVLPRWAPLVRAYRQGRCRVLERAIAEVETLVVQLASDDSEEDGGEDSTHRDTEPPAAES